MSVLSIAVIILGFHNLKFAIEENRQALKLRAAALVFLTFGAILHTIGDQLATSYGELLELTLESIAHVIILISFLIFLLSAKNILKKARMYWFK